MDCVVKRETNRISDGGGEEKEAGIEDTIIETLSINISWKLKIAREQEK